MLGELPGPAAAFPSLSIGVSIKTLHLNVEHNKLVMIGARQCVCLIQCLELPKGAPQRFF